jgi:hypothetical protein
VGGDYIKALIFKNMKCYDDIIGIRGLCEDKQYKYYLDDYGIGLRQLAKTSDDKYISGKKLFDTKLEQAWQSVFRDIEINGLKANKILSTSKVGKITTDEFAFTGLKGITFDAMECELATFYLKKISLHIKQGGATQVVIRVDGIDTVIYNDTVANDTVIVLNYNDYIKSDFSILVLGDNITVYDGSTTYTCDCKRNYYTVTPTKNYGLVVDIQVRCNPYDYLCNYVDLLAIPVIYKLLALIWKESLDSNRFNDFLNIKLGDNNGNAITQLAWLDSTFNLLKYDIQATKISTELGMYQIELEKLNIPIPDCPCCLECNGTSYKLSIP